MTNSTTFSRRLDLTLTLIDDVVLSQRPATEGGHESLDFIPGAALLGAVAARLYRQCSPDDAHTLFHSGAVRFGDGVPLDCGHPCWPMPLMWHYPKGKEAESADHRLVAALIASPKTLEDEDKNVQPKQLREGFVRGDGTVLRPNRSLRMKTAIAPETGRIKESQLFGYESIAAGQQFVMCIEPDDSVSEKLWGRVCAIFDAPVELLIGRSRSAEYGRVKAERSNAAFAPPETAAASDRLTLWCLTDLVLLDDSGQPTLDPQARYFGLNRGSLDPDGTFLRFRRYAPWNAHRQAHDLQRQVIRRGSVIAFTGIDPPLTDFERRRIEAGVGLYREQGLGRVCANPKLLATPHPDFGNPIHVPEQQEPAAPQGDLLIRWLAEQQSGGASRREAEVEAKAQKRALAKCYRLARTFAGVPAHVPVGPSPAQWGSVYEAARTATNRAELFAKLFDGDNASCKENGENWRDQFRDKGGVCTFRGWFEDSAATGLRSITAFRLFGREAQRIAQAEYRRDQED
jgi:CRISPR-associated protein Csx10